MRIARRTLLGASLSAIAAPVCAASMPTIRVGLLRFGTVSWEIDVIRHHGLDAAAHIAIEPVELAAAQAAQVALQSGKVDMIVVDWLWVARQRGAGADWTFVPFSNAVGALIAGVIYKPANDEISFARNTTEPCQLSCEFLETVRETMRESLSGKNAEAFLTEVGVAFHR